MPGQVGVGLFVYHLLQSSHHFVLIYLIILFGNKTIATLTTQRNFYTNVQYDDFLLVNMIVIIHLTFKNEESMFSKLIDA